MERNDHFCGHERVRPTNTFLNRKVPLRSGILFANPTVMHRPRSDSAVRFPLHFDIWKYTKFIRKNKMLALGACFPQSLPQALVTVSRSRLNYYQTLAIGPFPQKLFNGMLCKLDSTEHAHSFEPNPTALSNPAVKRKLKNKMLGNLSLQKNHPFFDVRKEMDLSRRD